MSVDSINDFNRFTSEPSSVCESLLYKSHCNNRRDIYLSGFYGQSEILELDVKRGFAAQFILVKAISAFPWIQPEWLCVGWCEFKLLYYGAGPFCYVDWEIDGSYGQEMLEHVDVGTVHRFELFCVSSFTWSARIDDVEVARKMFHNAPIAYQYQVVSESTYPYNIINGHWFNLHWWNRDGGLEDWDDVITYEEPPYKVTAEFGTEWNVYQTGGLEKWVSGGGFGDHQFYDGN